MNFREIALIEAYDRVKNLMPDDTQLGDQHRPDSKPFTASQMARFRRAYAREVARFEKRLEAAGIDFTPSGWSDQ